MSDSVSFGRAAAYYDETRGFSPEGRRKTIDLLARECASRGRVLEIGVGTGQLALPLHADGVSVVGLDLARPMLDRLVEKSGRAGGSRWWRATRRACRSRTAPSALRTSAGSCT